MRLFPLLFLQGAQIGDKEHFLGGGGISNIDKSTGWTQRMANYF